MTCAESPTSSPAPNAVCSRKRSRRQTDELHNTRPRWLRSISRGVNRILLAILVAVGWPLFLAALPNWVWFGVASSNLAVSLGWQFLPLLGFDFACIWLLMGGILLSLPEGYPPADRKDLKLRWMLRISAAIPLVALILLHLEQYLQFRAVTYRGSTPLEIAVVLLSTAGCAPLPLLLFLHLRGLAKRARSAHLAEHCMIVGIGTSCALLYILAVIIIFENAERLGLGSNWTDRGGTSLILLTIGFTAAILFILWSLYLLVRFAIAFWLASRQLRRKWTRDDRACVE